MRGLLIVALLCSSLAAQEHLLENSQYKFKATIPATFKPWPADNGMPSSSTFAAYYIGDLDDAVPDIVLGFENLGGLIGRNRLDVKGLPPDMQGPDMKIETEKWKDFEVDVLVNKTTVNGLEMLSCAAQIPLKPQ